MSGLMRRRRRRHQTAADLDITAFMNLMVILVPFLLITAVFSRVAVVDLFLPSDTVAAKQKKPVFMLQLMLRDNEIELTERRFGLKKKYPIVDGRYDAEGLEKLILQLKQRFPDQRQATLLAAPDVSYELLVSVMDNVRVRIDGADVYELFPDISIGDIPSAARSR